jgi:hypothetical protein
VKKKKIGHPSKVTAITVAAHGVTKVTAGSMIHTFCCYLSYSIKGLVGLGKSKETKQRDINKMATRCINTISRTNYYQIIPDTTE